MNPELAQHEREDELGDQQGLHDRNHAIVQSKRLEQERSGQSHPAEEPQRVAEQVHDQPPSRRPAWISGAGHVLSDDTDRIGQSRQQGEDDDHGRNDTRLPGNGTPSVVCSTW